MIRLHIYLYLLGILIVVPCRGSESGSKKVHAGRIPSKTKEYNGKTQLSPGESVDSLLIQEENIPPELQDLKHEHKILYLRARQKDYDFAKFGQPCQMISLEELYAFLQILDESIEPSEGNHDLHQRLNPEEKGLRLEKLFNHSHTICDFRNLLTCHDNFRTCACAHPSMGLNREGACGINIGHVCEFSERTLMKYGILLTQQTNPIKCLLENAECVMDTVNDIFGAGISPIRKICKCRKGFWGATCRRRQEDDAGGYLQNKPQQGIGKTSLGRPKKDVEIPPKEEVKGEDLSSREFWIHHPGTIIGGHSLHPEEIKEKLIEIMIEKKLFLPDEREKKAQDLLKHLEQDVDKEEMVVNELNLRALATLKLGDTCEPERQIILDNPPVAKDGQRFVDPNPEEIKSWQLGLLQDGKKFCNIYKNLRCDATTKLCHCRPGLEPDGGECVIPLGYNCGPDFDPILELDPIKDRKRFSEAMAPDCVKKSECKELPLFFEKKCWCKAGESCAGGFDMETFKSQVKAIKSRFTLALGDSCDPRLHQKLLSFGTADDPGYQKRITLIKEIIDNPEHRFCDIGNYLNCSETTRQCQCWQQLKPNEEGGDENGVNQCVASNLASCGKTFDYGKYLYLEGSQLWQVEKAFQSYFRPQCIPQAKCAGGDDLEWAGRCVCHDPWKTGELCMDRKAILTRSFRPRQIPNNDEEEIALIQVFFELNQQTDLMEQLMTLQLNDPCDPDTGLKVDRVVKFWREIGSSDDTIKERRTLKHFVGLTKWTKYLVNTVQGSSAFLCNVTRGLRCHKSTKTCGCARGTRWMGDRCYLEIDEACDPRPGALWVATCIAGTKCLSLRRNNYGSYQCTPCPEGRTHCTGNENDDRIMDTWDGYDGKPVLQGKGLGELQPETETTTPPKEAHGSVIEDADETPKTVPDPRMKDQNETEPRQPPPPKAPEVEVRKNMDNALTPHQRNTYLEEITRMLTEILSNRILPMDHTCRQIEEGKLTEIFPSLPIFDVQKSSHSIQIIYATLSRLYWQGISFCDRRQFLSCTINAKCGCAPKFGLIKEGGECRLKEDKYCRIADEDFPHPRRPLAMPTFKCRSGTRCTKLDYGLPICVKSAGFDLKPRKSLMMQGRSLFKSGDIDNVTIDTVSRKVKNNNLDEEMDDEEDDDDKDVEATTLNDLDLDEETSRGCPSLLLDTSVIFVLLFIAFNY